MAEERRDENVVPPRNGRGYRSLNKPLSGTNTGPAHPNQRAFTADYAGTASGRESNTGFRALADSQKSSMLFFVPDSDEAVSSWLLGCLEHLNKPSLDQYQAASTYLSIIDYYYIGMTEAIDNFYAARGFKKESVSLPSESIVVGVSGRVVKLGYLDQMLIVGQLTFLMYKNFTDANFMDYMTKRTKAVCAKLACELTKINIPFDVKIAMRIRRVVGGDVMVRSRIVQHLLDGRGEPTPYGNMCGYITKVIEWCEMGSFVFVNEVLVLNKSPVLADPVVALELRNFYEAVCVVRSKQYPQFFRLMAVGDEYHLLDRSQYPTLIDVAVAIKMDSHPTLKRFLTPEATGRGEVIERLKKLHAATEFDSPHPSLDSIVASLTETG